MCAPKMLSRKLSGFKICNTLSLYNRTPLLINHTGYSLNEMQLTCLIKDTIFN